MHAHRFGIFGGTFDPPHVGHLLIAAEAHRQLGLEQVLMVVAGDPWQKAGEEVSDSGARWEMVVAAAEGLPWLVPLDIELRRQGPTYTIDTVEALGCRGELVLVVGTDVAERLHTWHRVEDLAKLVVLAVADRPGTDLPVLPNWNVERVEVPGFDVSSTEVRERVARGESLDDLVPEGVRAVVERRGLYRLG